MTKAGELKRMKSIQKGLQEAEKAKDVAKKLVSLLKKVTAYVEKLGKSAKPNSKKKPTERNLFYKAHFKKVQAAHPNKTFGEISKIVSKMYSDSKKGSKSAKPTSSPFLPMPVKKKSKADSKPKAAKKSPKAKKPKAAAKK